MRSDELKVEALCREILDSVLCEIKGEYEQLPQALRALTDETKDRYEEEATNMRFEHRQNDSRERVRSISQAQFKAKKDVLRKRDELLDELLTKGYEEALQRWQKTKDTNLVLPLVEEGVTALDCQDVVVTLNEEKKGHFGGGLIKLLQEHFTKKITVEYGEHSPGVIVSRADGRALYDNTIKDRFRRCSLQLRVELAKLLDEEVKRQRDQSH